MFLDEALSSEAEATLIKYLQQNDEKLEDSFQPNNEEESSHEPTKLRTTGVKPPYTETGGAGSWRANMTPSCAEKFDKWTKEKLAGTDFSNIFMIIWN